MAIASPKNVSPHPQSCEKNAFPRGYHRGVAEAVCLMREGKSVDEIFAWMSGPVADWRYLGGGDENPPAFK